MMLSRLLSEPRWLSVHTLRLDSRWDPTRSDPRFQALIRKHSGRRRRTPVTSGAAPERLAAAAADRYAIEREPGFGGSLGCTRSDPATTRVTLYPSRAERTLRSSPV